MYIYVHVHTCIGIVVCRSVRPAVRPVVRPSFCMSVIIIFIKITFVQYHLFIDQFMIPNQAFCDQTHLYFIIYTIFIIAVMVASYSQKKAEVVAATPVVTRSRLEVHTFSSNIHLSILISLHLPTNYICWFNAIMPRSQNSSSH